MGRQIPIPATDERSHEMTTRIFLESEIRRSAPIDQQSLSAIESAFNWLQQGLVDMPPIMHIHAADRNGDVDVKSAYVRGLPYFAIKIASGFYENPSRGLPAGSAMMVLLNSETGFCEAVLLDNGYLTDLRTGLAGAVAAKYLAPTKVTTVGVLGTGTQARYQLRSLALVREFEQVLVWGRDVDKAHAYAEEMQDTLGLAVEVSGTIADLVAGCQVVITTTPSKAPLIDAKALHPGLLVCAVGADFPGKQELHPAVLHKADRVVCDRLSQCLSNGELQHVVVGGRPQLGHPVEEIGQITNGLRAGRVDAAEIIVCDLTGTGVQDSAIANLAYNGLVAVSHQAP